jgi:hypothetical protein
MATTTPVRIGSEAHEAARQLAAETGRSVRDIIERSVLAYQGHWIIEQTNRAAERMQREDPQAWGDYQAEAKLWEATLMDGLHDEPPYPVPEQHRQRAAEPYRDQT